jgi:serpin B
VDLAIPKLKLTYERTLNDDLKALGMTSAFDPRMADFTRMSPMGRSLVIDFVKQKTFVDINEEGTEAAAVTVAGVVPTCACPPVPVAMRVDRPYIFAIREQFSGTLLFMAKIVRMP